MVLAFFSEILFILNQIPVAFFEKQSEVHKNFE